MGTFKSNGFDTPNKLDCNELREQMISKLFNFQFYWSLLQDKNYSSDSTPDSTEPRSHCLQNAEAV